MRMKNRHTVLLFLCGAAAALLAAACSNEEDILPEQQSQTVRFLTSTHAPRLVAADASDEESQQPFYTTAGNTVYRYIEDYYNPDRAQRAEVNERSVVTITFRMYRFTYSNITTSGSSVTMPFYSNDPLLKEAYQNAGLTPGAWDFTPYEIDMARGGIINGLRLALLGCRRGDRVEAYMTYNMAYGSDHLGIIERESPIAIFFTVDSVE